MFLFKTVFEVDQFQEVTVSLLGNTQENVWCQNVTKQPNFVSLSLMIKQR
jgi:hypothetical protein